MKKTIIFDLDGTLVDIEPIFFRIFNTLAPVFGYAPIRPDEIPTMKKLPLRRFLWQRLGWRMLLLPFFLQRGRNEYHALVSEVELFSGIKELVENLRSRNFTIGIVSSSRRETATALMEKFDLQMDFVYQSSLFNKAKALKLSMREKGLTLSEAIYVGDEVRDVDACHKAGLDIIAVTWGLNSKEALKEAGATTVDTREELLEKILAS